MKSGRIGYIRCVSLRAATYGEWRAYPGAGSLGQWSDGRTAPLRGAVSVATVATRGSAVDGVGGGRIGRWTGRLSDPRLRRIGSL